MPCLLHRPKSSDHDVDYFPIHLPFPEEALFYSRKHHPLLVAVLCYLEFLFLIPFILIKKTQKVRKPTINGATISPQNCPWRYKPIARAIRAAVRLSASQTVISLRSTLSSIKCVGLQNIKDFA
jgi:hypothetical protein